MTGVCPKAKESVTIVGVPNKVGKSIQSNSFITFYIKKKRYIFLSKMTVHFTPSSVIIPD